MDRPERVRVRSALLASPMLLISPLVPTTIVAMIGTIMIRPSLDQMGRSRSRPTGTRRRDDSVVGVVVGRLLTSPPSEPAPPCPAGTRDRPTLLGQTSEIPPCLVPKRKPGCG